MKEKEKIILVGEEVFARAVALGMVVKRPPSPWYVLIPGMFILEIFRRNAAIRQYREVFLFPRKVALETARSILAGQQDDNACWERARTRIKGWLRSHKVLTDRLFEAHQRLLELLVPHYCRLLRAEGNTLYSLIRDAYKTRTTYESFLAEVESAERQIDEALAERFEQDPQVLQRLQAEREQVDNQRKKEVDNLF